MSTSFIPTGAILQTLLAGVQQRNIVLNFNTAAEYQHNPSHFGASIGRIANRVRNATINQLDGRTWKLEANDGKNSLHGGTRGWGKQEWTAGPAEDGKASFSYTSKHLDEGFPGEVEVAVTYTTTEPEPGKTVVTMDYEARLVGGSEETAVNITNHSYFNLSGLPTIEGTEAVLSTNLHLPLDAGGIPLGNSPAPYAGITANKAFTLGVTDPDIDDCFVFADAIANPGSIPLDTRSSPLRVCAKFYHPESKIHLEVASTEPAFQFYTGKYVDVEARADGTPKRVSRAGFCVEPSRFVDSVNRDEWKGSVLLKKDGIYGSKIVYTVWEGAPQGV